MRRGMAHNWKLFVAPVGVCVTLLLLVATSGGSAGQQPVAAKDMFTGVIETATGSFEADHGRVRISLRPEHSTSAVRSVTVGLTALQCRARKRCLKLSGDLTGTLVARRSLPDTGSTFAIHAGGTLARIGRAVGTGVVEGTGFIARGRERLQLNLAASRGHIAIDASSGSVPGFTSP
jgi:hypothetical protein